MGSYIEKKNFGRLILAQVLGLTSVVILTLPYNERLLPEWYQHP